MQTALVYHPYLLEFSLLLLAQPIDKKVFRLSTRQFQEYTQITKLKKLQKCNQGL